MPKHFCVIFCGTLLCGISSTDVRIGDDANDKKVTTKKEQPAWMTSSTISGVDNTPFLSNQVRETNKEDQSAQTNLFSFMFSIYSLEV